MIPTSHIFYQRLKRHYSQAVIGRGEPLFRNGHVFDLQPIGNDKQQQHYSAWVLGSQYDNYHVSLQIDDNAIRSDCDCPFRHQCKHGVAVALAVAEYIQSARQTQAGPGDALEQWLARLQQQLRPAATVQVVDEQQWQLQYLVDSKQWPLRVAIAERYRKRNGDWGRYRQPSLFNLQWRPDFSANDAAILEIVHRCTPCFIGPRAAVSDGYELYGSLAYVFLQHALRSGRAHDMHSGQPLQYGRNCQLHLNWQADSNDYRLYPELEPPPDTAFSLLPCTPPLYRCADAIGMLETPLDGESLALLLTMPPVAADRLQLTCSQLQQLLGEQALPLPEGIAPIRTLDHAAITVTLLSINTKQHGYLPALCMSFSYGTYKVCPDYLQAGQHQHLQHSGDTIEQQGETVLVSRDYAGEYAALDSLPGFGLSAQHVAGEDNECWMPAAAQPQQHVLRWNQLLPRLQQYAIEQDWQIVIDDSYRSQRSSASYTASAQNHSGGWFDLQLDLAVAGTTLDSNSLLQQWLAAGTPDVLPVQDKDQHWLMADMSTLRPLLALLQELYDGDSSKPLRLPAFRAGALDDIEHVNFKQAPSLKKLQQQLKNFQGLKPVTPARQLQATLRDYQQHGLNWLMFLHRHQFGGILADDMGLGKTLQTLAFLQKLKSTGKLTRGALIVAPTSLLWNWQNEAQRFTPNLTVTTLHGAQRQALFASIDQADIVITSYALIQRDFAIYQQRHFDLTILDEAQKIKNSEAKTTRLIKQLPADMRLCLTGTPLENHLGELWSISDFVLPGLLGNKDYFDKHLRQPIEQHGNADASIALSRRIAPFMLRRSKSDVATELPKKTEIVQTVELAADQKVLYESIRLSMEKKVRELIQQKGVARSHIEFLDALLKLRQACIDPRLVKLEKARKVKHSAKMDWLKETLPEMVEEGRRILLFSQFTGMLDLVEKQLQKIAIASVKLTGRTRHRQAVIEQFQNGDVPVFLISLKAGGAGLNLTAADTVIHIDPWWNPAVENQATDRAYRIGQDKPVFVYKLVAAGTVEEKIQALQQEKQALADSLLDATSKASLPKTGDDLLALLRQ